MSTTLRNLDVRRYVRTVSSGLATNTEWVGLMAVNAAALAAAPWHETPDAASTLPVNDPTQSFAGATAYDAWKQSGNAAAGTGRQCAYAGMACYRIPLPAGCTATGASVRVAADKFCVGGLTLVAILSDADAPQAEWTAETTGNACSTGLVAETAEKVSASQNRSAVVDLELAAGSGRYLYLLVALTDYTAARREYWIEGSGCIDAASIAVTVAETVSEIVSLDEIPLETVPCFVERENAAPVLVQRAWALYRNDAAASGGSSPESVGTRLCASLLSGGAATAAAAGGANEATAGFCRGVGASDENDTAHLLAAGVGPLVQGHAPGFVRASLAAVYLNDRALAGRTLSVPVRAESGSGVFRVLLVETGTPDVSAFDWSSGATLAGAADAILAASDVIASSERAECQLQIRRDAATPFAFLVVLPVSVSEMGGRDDIRLEPINPNALSIR